MAANLTSEKPILTRCLDHLNEVFRISNDISDLMDTEEYSKMESLFTNRGQAIASLSELEQALNRLMLRIQIAVIHLLALVQFFHF